MKRAVTITGGAAAAFILLLHGCSCETLEVLPVDTQPQPSVTLPPLTLPETNGNDASTFDVIVVGAGFAGISAASALHDAGHSVIVLEARERPGRCGYPPAAGMGGGHKARAHDENKGNQQAAEALQDTRLALCPKLSVLCSIPPFPASNTRAIRFPDWLNERLGA
jgi:hypothetical protein